VIVESSALVTKKSQTKFDKFTVAIEDSNIEISKLQNGQVLEKRTA
jgi:hypothetical protein